jgi:hypothetical protein
MKLRERTVSNMSQSPMREYEHPFQDNLLIVLFDLAFLRAPFVFFVSFVVRSRL